MHQLQTKQKKKNSIYFLLLIVEKTILQLQFIFENAERSATQAITNTNKKQFYFSSIPQTNNKTNKTNKNKKKLFDFLWFYLTFKQSFPKNRNYFSFLTFKKWKVKIKLSIEKYFFDWKLFFFLHYIIISKEKQFQKLQNNYHWLQ